MGILEAMIFAVGLLIVIGVVFGINHNLEQTIVAKIDALHAAVVPQLSVATTKLTTLEDKAKNAITDIEKSKLIEELKAGMTKAEQYLGILAPDAPVVEPAPAVVIVPPTQVVAAAPT